MGLIVKKGVISHLSENVVTTGRNGNYASQHATAFRIGDMPAKLKSGSHNSFNEGDKITAVGAIKKGTLVIYAIRKDTTGAYDEAQTIVPLLLGICMLVLGIPLSFIIIGLPLLFYGGMMLYSVYLGQQAKNLLHATPRS